MCAGRAGRGHLDGAQFTCVARTKMPSLLALLLQVERDKAISMVLEESKKKEKQSPEKKKESALESGTAAEEEISEATLKRLRKEAPEGRMLFLFSLPFTFSLFFSSLSFFPLSRLSF